MPETWTPITIFPYSKNYAVSNFGRIKRTTPGSKTYANKILKPTNINGYLHIVFYYEDQKKMFRVNRIIALAFIPNPENKPQVNHLDGNKLNNCVDNLEWCTHQENKQHAAKNNLVAKGITHGMSKLTNEQVKEIKSLYQKGKRGFSTCALAKQYGVDHKTVWRIVNNKTWCHT